MQTSAHALVVKRLLELELRAAAAGRHRALSTKLTLLDIYNLYFETNPRKVAAETIKRDRINARDVCRLIDAAVPPEEIDEPLAVRYSSAREKELAAPRTILNEFSFLKRILDFGARWQSETGMTGTRLLEIPDVGDWQQNGVALTEDEIGALLDVARDRERGLLIAGITTMLRRTPLLALQQPWIDAGEAWLSVPADFMKKGRSRRRHALEVPLARWAVETLAEAEPVNGYYWPSSKRGLPMTWVEHIIEDLPARTAAAGAKVPSTTSAPPAASLLRAAKVDGLGIAILLGHGGTFDAATDTFSSRRGADVTEGYTKLFELTFRQAVAVFDEVRSHVGI